MTDKTIPDDVALAANEASKAETQADPVASPGHTDMMVSPESLDEWLEDNSPPVDWDDLAEQVKIAIDDSFDVDWTSKDAARSVVDMLKERGLPEPVDKAVEDERPTWPTRCHDPSSCERHRVCMYVNCYHEERFIEDEIDTALAALRNRGGAS